MSCHIEIFELKKKFGQRTALAGISAEFRPGSITLVTGPNASGKTTLIRLIAGLLSPTAGEIRFSPLRPSIGLVLEHRHLYPLLTVRENLELFSSLCDCQPEAVPSAVAAFDLNAVEREPLQMLSRGQKQRVALARAFQSRPQLLLLDEPFSGLDEHHQAAFVREIDRARDHGACAIIASQVMTALPRSIDHVLALDRGGVLYNGPWKGSAFV